MSIYPDFMAVQRCIPPRQRPHLIDDAAESTSADTQQASSEDGADGYEKSLDPAVQKTALILETVLSDNTPRQGEVCGAHRHFLCLVWVGEGR
jgi:hypothetical protein